MKSLDINRNNLLYFGLHEIANIINVPSGYNEMKSASSRKTICVSDSLLLRNNNNDVMKTTNKCFNITIGKYLWWWVGRTLRRNITHGIWNGTCVERSSLYHIYIKAVFLEIKNIITDKRLRFHFDWHRFAVFVINLGA